MKDALQDFVKYLKYFLRDVLCGLIVGALGGLVGAAFCWAVGWATGFRAAHSWIIWLLPAAGLLIVRLYSFKGLHPTDTNGVLVSVRSPSGIPASTAPLIFVSTVITHLFGGSAGREGAALQLGGVLGWHTSKLLKQDEKERHIMVMTGMSAVFSALFGSPVTAAIFAMEVTSVGILHFSAAVPCLVSSLTAALVAKLLGVSPELFPVAPVDISLKILGSALLIAVLCAVVSIIYCVSLSQFRKLSKKLLPNPYLRIAAAGLTIALLTEILGTTDYNGAGMDVVSRAVGGSARPEAFILKLLFTVITMSCGYKGGEIVPAMFIGATLGCTVGNLLGLPAGIGAAVGLIAMFCGSLNCPISGVFLGLELFGGGNLLLYAVSAAAGYMMSENYGLYSEQKIVYSKLRPEFIDSYTKQD
ncbi:MAG: chloride channel protein [Candidatus Limivicinus sp.]|jgi:H+/Cl- antiporter ClcA